MMYLNTACVFRRIVIELSAAIEGVGKGIGKKKSTVETADGLTIACYMN
jgi:hypothetical protein